MKKFLRKVVVPLVVAAVFLGMLDPTLVMVPVKLVWAVGFGWISVLGRLLPGLEYYWGNLTVWTLGMVITFAGLHSLFRRLRTEWPVRWSVAMFSVVWLGILASMALIGVTHQFVWMVASKEPPLTPRGDIRLRVNANRIRSMAREANWKEKDLKKLMWDSRWSIWEDFNVVLQSDGNGMVTNLFVIDRSGRVGFVTVNPTGSKVEPMNALVSQMRGN